MEAAAAESAPAPRRSPPHTSGPAVVLTADASSEEGPDATGSNPARPEDAPAHLLVQGTISVFDSEGVEHPAEDGWFKATLEIDQGMRPLPIHAEVRDGRFDYVPPDRPCWIEVKEMVLGEKLTWAESGVRVRVRPGNALKLRAVWPSPLVVHVLDEATGEELKGVELRAHGDSSGPVVGDSPLTIQPPKLEADTRYSVDAPGYESATLEVPSPAEHAWQTPDVPAPTATERFIELSRAGKLIVRFSGRLHQPLSDFAVRLGQPDHDVGFTLTALDSSPDDRCREYTGGVSRTVELNPAVGKYRAAVDVEDIVVGEAYCEVRAGETTEVVVPLDQYPPVGHVPLAGTLEISPGWEISAIDLQILADDIPLTRPDDPKGPGGVLQWDAGMMRPGRYVAKVRATDQPPFAPLHLATTLETGIDGNRSARIELPPPCDLDVYFVWDGAKLPIREWDLDWQEVWWGESSVTGMVKLRRLLEAGRSVWRARVPAGRVRFRSVHMGSLDLTPAEFEAPPGRAEVTLTLTMRRIETGVLIVSAMDGPRRVPCARPRFLREDGSELQPEVWSLTLAHALEGSQWEAWPEIETDPFQKHFAVSHEVECPAGTVQVILPRPPGYLAPEPFWIRIEPGKVVEHGVSLRRH